MSPTSASPRVRSGLLAGLGLSLLLTGCGALSDETGGGTGSEAGRPKVAAGFYPLAWVAEQVGGDRAEVQLLTRPGQEAHDGGLTIERTVELAEADLVLLSAALQPEVDASAEQNARGRVLDVADSVDLLPATEHGHGDHEHEDEEDEGQEGHDNGDEDPHFWLDPLLMADLGDAVAAELAEIDPEQATAYTRDAEALRRELVDLDAEYAERLADCTRTTVVVSHDAFGYLRRYGLTFEPIAGLSPDAEPTPADLQHLQELIRTQGITTVFSETLGTSALAGSLARDAGVVTDTLDPIEGLTDAGSDDDYLSLMHDNLSALERAGGC